MPELAVKVAQEAQAGRAASTDILIGAAVQIISMMESDALLPVDWANWAPNVQDTRLIAPGGVAVQLASRAVGITYHSTRNQWRQRTDLAAGCLEAPVQRPCRLDAVRGEF